MGSDRVHWWEKADLLAAYPVRRVLWQGLSHSGIVLVDHLECGHEARVYDRSRHPSCRRCLSCPPEEGKEWRP